MRVMCRLRGTRSHLSRPDLRFVRTVQAPDQVVFNKHTNRYEASSAAFTGSSNGGSLSGDLEELIQGDGLPLDILYPAVKRGVGAVTFRVQDALDLGLHVHHEPVAANWYHGGVRGNLKKTETKLKAVANELIEIDQEASRLYHEKKDAAARSAAKSPVP